MIPSSAPFVTVTQLGIEFPALLDTGPGLSLIGDAVLVQCMQSQKGESKGDEHSFAACVGHDPTSAVGGTALYAFRRRNV